MNRKPARVTVTLVNGLGTLAITALVGQELAVLHIKHEEVPHAEAVGTAGVVYTPTVSASGTTGQISAGVHPILVQAAFPTVYPPTVALPQPFPAERVDPRGFYSGHAYHESNHAWLVPAPPRPRARPRQFTFRE